MRFKSPYWWIEVVVHVVFWTGLLLLMVVPNDGGITLEEIGTPRRVIDTNKLLWITYGISAVIFYFNLLVLDPRLFRKQHYVAYIILLMVFATALSLVEYNYLNTVYNPFAGYFYKNPAINHGIFLLFSVVYVLTKNHVRLNNERKEIKANQQHDELTFLKSQLNPHFLFNSINNIFSIAQKNDDNEVAEYLSGLSKIMRYALYESNGQKVLLEKELIFLESYIQMSLLKFSEEDLKLHFEIKGAPSHQMIAPLLLVPLVENAFKHGPVPGKRAVMKIHVAIDNNSLSFEVMNSYGKKVKSTHTEVGGIGLKNLKRRLELLYPNDHDFETVDTGDTFEIKLKIRLNGA